jgi:manganese/zinc/iron transport system permease protein
MTVLGGSGKALPGLLLGATLTGILGVAWILAIVHGTRIKEDAAMGIVLSVFFGMGISVLGVIQNMGTGSAAGLESFISGKAASMIAADAWLVGGIAAAITLACLLLFKEFSLLCFDPSYAGTLGRPVVLLDGVLMALVVAATVIGLQAVGLILMVALLIIPPVAARFWTDHLPTMFVVSACLGALSGLLGAAASALVPRLPAGAVIVVIAGGFFILSLIFGSARGLLFRAFRQHTLKRRIERQHLLRAMYELSETEGEVGMAVPRIPVGFDQLLQQRSWSPVRLRSAIRSAERAGLMISADGRRSFVLTPEGVSAAGRAARNHRLWELFLIAHADIAPSHVDRDADEVEHVLRPEMIETLETLLAKEHPDLSTPPSPHWIEGRGTTALAGISS